VTFDVFDVVVTHFPFADRSAEKKRPAVVLSGFDNFGSATGVALVAMITTSVLRNGCSTCPWAILTPPG